MCYAKSAIHYQLRAAIKPKYASAIIVHFRAVDAMLHPVFENHPRCNGAIKPHLCRRSISTIFHTNRDTTKNYVDVTNRIRYPT